MKTYKTAEVASIIGIHPNTVRLYEELHLIPRPERQPNGYRIFTDFHIEQLRLARIAFQIEVLQNGLRKKIIQMIKVSADRDFDTALALSHEYILQARQERANAEEAIEIVKRLLSGGNEAGSRCLKRKEVSEYLHVSMDTLELGDERPAEGQAQAEWVPGIYGSRYQPPEDHPFLTVRKLFAGGNPEYAAASMCKPGYRY